MLHYWFTILKILILRNFQRPIHPEDTLSRTFRVRLFDCDGLRVMTASKYPAYMDFIRWELIARSKLYQAIVKNGLAPALGSQKIIYRKPIKIWTKFNLVLDTVGWDEKWIYHVHKFEQKGELKAIGITRALIWRKDVPSMMEKILLEAGAKNLKKTPPAWVTHLFEDDKEIIKNNQPA